MIARFTNHGWRLLALPLAAMVVGANPVPPKELRGRDNADCRQPENGPAVRLTVNGLRDRDGVLRFELYPANEDDFLAADKDLIAAGKVFKRVEVPVPANGMPVVCIRAPRPGNYAVVVLHDRDGNGKFGFMRDGVAFPGDPRLRRGPPPVERATVTVGSSVLQQQVTMQYLRGFTFSPLR